VQARETGQIIDDRRALYASGVVGRVLQAHGQRSTSCAPTRGRALWHAAPCARASASSKRRARTVTVWTGSWR
jgi:hypothetical protein